MNLIIQNVLGYYLIIQNEYRSFMDVLSYPKWQSSSEFSKRGWRFHWICNLKSDLCKEGVDKVPLRTEKVQKQAICYSSGGIQTLRRNGFVPEYLVWDNHGEEATPSNTYDQYRQRGRKRKNEQVGEKTTSEGEREHRSRHWGHG